MMDDKPKRRAWFQLHLSTCVVLMVVEGVLVAANVVGRHKVDLNPDGKVSSDYLTYGWPMVAVAEYRVRPEIDPEVDGLSAIYLHDFEGWSGTGIAVDLAVGTGVILATAAACESVTRRKDASGTGAVRTQLEDDPPGKC